MNPLPPPLTPEELSELSARQNEKNAEQEANTRHLNLVERALALRERDAQTDETLTESENGGVSMSETGNPLLEEEEEGQGQGKQEKCAHCSIAEVEMKKLHETLANKELMIAKLMKVAANYGDLIQRRMDLNAKISDIIRPNDA